MGIESFGENERAKEQDNDRLKGGYGGDYFDENEHRAGQEKRDLSTGNPIKNDGDIEAIAIEKIDEESLFERDSRIKKEFNDDAEKYLRENDPEYMGLGEIKKKEDKGQREAA